MDLALQAALLGAVMGSAVLAASTIYGWTLPAAPHAYGWWAAAFVLETASKGVLLGGAAPSLIQASDVIHGLAAGLVLCGALTFAGRRVTPVIMAGGLAASLVWAFAAFELRAHFGPVELPLFGIGGLPVLYAAWVLSGRTGRGNSGPDHAGGHHFAALAFAADGLHQLAAPLLHVHIATATLSFVVSQVLSMAMAVGLLLVVVRRQQALAESEGERANVLQARLVEALGSVQDGIALYDGNDRLVTSNARYSELLAPAATTIRPGRSFRDIVKAKADHGVIAEAKGREEDWVFDVLADHASDAPLREMQLWDGRWVAVSVYRTADGGHLRILRDVTNRKQAELSLEESVAWLRGIMDTVIDGILTIDDSGTVLSLNPAAARIFGYSVDEVVGRNVSMLMPEPYKGEHDSYIQRYVSTGEARVVGIGRQVNGQRKDGLEFPMELSITEMRQADMVTFIGVVRDITDRKKVEDALVDSEQRFRDLAESASDWFWEVDTDFKFTFVSGRVRQVLGVGPGMFLGRDFASLADAAESPNAWQEQCEVMRQRNPFRGFVFVHTTPAGAVKFVEMAGRPAFDAADIFQGYRGTATDITPIKRHEQDLAAQAALRQATIDNMAQGVVVFDDAKVLVALNSHTRTMLGLAEGEAEPGRIVTGGALAALAEMGPDAVLEHAGFDDKVLEVRSNSMPGGGLILTLTDITDRKRFEGTLRDAKEAAERGNRAKATFLANISHELRTPLNAIIGFSELIKHEIFGPLEPESYRTYVGDIHESGMHLLELINDILDMSKAEAGMTDLVDSVVDVSAILRSSVRMMARRAETNQIALREDLPDDLPFLRGDEKRVRQIVLNLMSNAVKFTEEGGTVTVSAGVGDGGFEIRVTDTGIGMSPEDLERVMEPFVQADTRLSRKYEGTGLGLPLTRALVRAHGGTLILNSVPEQGTTAIATFPPERVILTVADAVHTQDRQP